MLSCSREQDRLPPSILSPYILVLNPRNLKPIRWHEQDWPSRMDTDGLVVGCKPVTKGGKQRRNIVRQLLSHRKVVGQVHTRLVAIKKLLGAFQLCIAIDGHEGCHLKRRCFLISDREVRAKLRRCKLLGTGISDKIGHGTFSPSSSCVGL